MEAIRVGVYMEDIYHAEAIATALNYLGGFEACGIDNEGGFDDFDVMIVQDDIREKHLSCDKPNIRIVSDKLKEDMNSSPIRIHMAQNVKVLAEGLAYSLGRKSIYQDTARDSEKARVIVVSSDKGGVGVTTLSVALGRCLYRLFEERALYLSLSPYNSAALSLLSLSEKADEYRGSFVRLIYGIQSGKDYLIQASIAEGQDIDAVKIPAVNIDCAAISECELERLAEKAAKLGYAYILIDMGNQFDDIKKRIIENAFCLISVNSGVKYQSGARRSIYVSNTVSKSHETFFDADAVIPFDDEISSNLLDNDFGRTVNKIAFLLGGDDEI